MYYLQINGEKKGPYTIGQLRSMWASGVVTVDTRYWFDGLNDWLPLANMVNDLEPTALSAATTGPSAKQIEPAKPGKVNLGCGLLLISAIIPLVGIVVGIVYICDEKRRNDGIMLIVFTIFIGIVWSILVCVFAPIILSEVLSSAGSPSYHHY